MTWTASSISKSPVVMCVLVKSQQTVMPFVPALLLTVQNPLCVHPSDWMSLQPVGVGPATGFPMFATCDCSAVIIAQHHTILQISSNDFFTLTTKHVRLFIKGKQNDENINATAARNNVLIVYIHLFTCQLGIKGRNGGCR